VSRKYSSPAWLTPERAKPAVITGLVLLFSSYSIDTLLSRLGDARVATLLNSLLIGILGALFVAAYLSSTAIDQNYRRAKERMILVAELNHHVRSALTLIQSYAALDDTRERVRLTEEAVERIDHVLSDLVPTVGSAESPRLTVPEKN
jgi:signal transduction histidine kinase